MHHGSGSCKLHFSARLLWDRNFGVSGILVVEFILNLFFPLISMRAKLSIKRVYLVFRVSFPAWLVVHPNKDEMIF